jgi:hypothetical protein
MRPEKVMVGEPEKLVAVGDDIKPSLDRGSA